MKIGTKDENLNKTVINNGDRNDGKSPDQRAVDLNMTAPLNSEQLKQGRKIVNEFVGSSINPTKERNSINY